MRLEGDVCLLSSSSPGHTHCAVPVSSLYSAINNYSRKEMEEGKEEEEKDIYQQRLGHDDLLSSHSFNSHQTTPTNETSDGHWAVSRFVEHGLSICIIG